MRGLFVGGLHSMLVFAWLVISLVIFFLCYKRLSKQMLIVIGSVLGSILMTLGIMGFFSGLANVMRTIGETASLTVQSALDEGIHYARIPFSFAIVATIIYFIVITILIVMKKQPFKRWALWAGCTIFLLLSFAPAIYRQMMNTRLLQGIGRIMGHGDTIPVQILPIVRAGRSVVITTLALFVVYLLVAVLATIFKRKMKPDAADQTPAKEEKKEGPGEEQ